jgi:hypothetical protein
VVFILLVACGVLSCLASLAFRNGFRFTGVLCVIAAICTAAWCLWIGAVLLA